MDSHPALVRLQEFQIEARRRKVAQVETMIAEFEWLIAELDREIGTEQDRTGNHDPSHFAYSTYAKATMQRRDNLVRSTAELRTQLEAARLAALSETSELPDMPAAQDGHPLRRRSDMTRREAPPLDLNQAF
jgi:flagellar protein FliJ